MAPSSAVLYASSGRFLLLGDGSRLASHVYPDIFTTKSLTATRLNAMADRTTLQYRRRARMNPSMLSSGFADSALEDHTQHIFPNGKDAQGCSEVFLDMGYRSDKDYRDS